MINLATQNDSKFLHIDELVHQYYNFGIYLLIHTKVPPPLLGYGTCYSTTCLYYSWKLNFWFRFEKANQPRFKTIKTSYTLLTGVKHFYAAKVSKLKMTAKTKNHRPLKPIQKFIVWSCPKVDYTVCIQFLGLSGFRIFASFCNQGKQ